MAFMADEERITVGSQSQPDITEEEHTTVGSHPQPNTTLQQEVEHTPTKSQWEVDWKEWLDDPWYSAIIEYKNIQAHSMASPLAEGRPKNHQEEGRPLYVSGV